MVVLETRKLAELHPSAASSPSAILRFVQHHEGGGRGICCTGLHHPYSHVLRVLGARQVPRVKDSIRTETIEKNTGGRGTSGKKERKKSVHINECGVPKFENLGGGGRDPFLVCPCHVKPCRAMLPTVLRYERENEKNERVERRRRKKSSGATLYQHCWGGSEVANGGVGESAGEVR